MLSFQFESVVCIWMVCIFVIFVCVLEVHVYMHVAVSVHFYVV